MRVPRLSVPLLTQLPRAPFISHRANALDPDASPDASDARHPRENLSQARRLRRQRRLARHQSQRSPIHAMGAAMRETVFSRPIWRIGRAPVAPGSSTAPAADVVLELPAGGSSARHALPASAGGGALGLSDEMPAPALRRRVWALSAPAIGEQLLSLGVGVSDTFLSGHLSSYASGVLGYGQATAVAAVGAAGMATWIVLTSFFAVNVGVTALVARATGARDPKLASRAAGQGILMGALIGLALVAIAVPMADLVTVALGVDGQVASLAAQFIRVASLGMPAAGVASACTAAMRGAGDTRRPMLVMLLVNGVNVVASWLLLNGDTRLGIPLPSPASAWW